MDSVPPGPGADAHRLPRHVVPGRYDLVLAPDLDEATFTGTVDIGVEIAEPTDEILLNAAELDIDAAWVEPAGSAEGVDATVALDAGTERARLELTRSVDPGPAVIHLSFAGILNDQLHGFYRSTFTDDDGDERTIATTQFEATDARRAFPCFDEPDRKAVFAVTLVVGDGLTAVSNAREIGSEPDGNGHRAVRFADTMPMSTYLVAFIVGPLEITDPIDVEGTPLRVVHIPGKGELTSFALEVGAFALRHFAHYYDIAYPGDKLDLVALPDFAFGAMENLGCVTFREVLLLVDPDQATQPELQSVVDVIAHELAHMWFGDLVTMRWWNGIWLNEAFATFMEMLATDAFRPEWDRWVSFGLSRSAALDVDALASTRPIEYPVVSPEDAEAMFDILTYEKGAAVVRMLEQYLGAEPFRTGIARYLRAHQHGNTETTDLWDAIEAATDEPTRRIMDSWIFQSGFPVVSVERTDTGVRLNQERFTYLPTDDADPTTWSIPILISTDRGGARQLQKELLESASLDVDLEPFDWVLVNAGGSGFYRVRYDSELLSALADQAQSELAPIERYGVVDDAWASVLRGDSDAASFVTLTETNASESDLSVWERMLSGLSALDRMLDGDARAALQARVRALVEPARQRLGSGPDPEEPDRTGQLRAALLGAAATLGADPEAQAWARDLRDAYDRDPTSVHPALAAASVGILAEVGETADYERFLSGFRESDGPQERLRYLYSLTMFDDRELFGRTLELVRSDEVRSQNGPYVLRSALTNRERGDDAWTFLTEHWDELTDRFPSNSVARMLEGIRSLSTPDRAARVRAFLDDHPVPQGAKTVAQHLERLEVNVALRSRESARLAAALT